MSARWHAAVPPAAGAQFAQLLLGLLGFGVSLALMVRADLGLGPWDVLHQGMSRLLGLSIGTVVIATGAAVMLLWIPLRERPGVGTLLNVAVVGVVVDATLRILAPQHGISTRAALLAGGIALNGFATGLYIGAGLGPGPRDGLMTGVARRGYSIRLVRTSIEITVLGAGFALGGSVGIGTIFYALCIGPLTHYFLPRLARPHGGLR